MRILNNSISTVLCNYIDVNLSFDGFSSLMQLRHPNVVKYHKAFQESK